MKKMLPLSFRCVHALLFLTGVPWCLAAAVTSDPVAAESLVFAEVNGLVVFEAEHFFRQELAERRAWHRTSAAQPPAITSDADPAHHEGASGGAYIEALPDTRATHHDPLVRGENFSNEPGLMAVVSYRIHVTTPGRYHVWARVYSTGTEDNGVHFGLDGAWPESGRRWQTTKKNAWSWDSRQRTEQVHTGVPGQLYLDFATPGEHVLQISMREDGFEIDRILLTNDPAYVPAGLGPPARVFRGTLPNAAGPDGDRLTRRWWRYADADSAASRVALAHAESLDRATFVLPAEPGKRIHLILEATDDGAPRFTGYQRVVCTIR